MFGEKNGMPLKAFPNGWKGECGLYAVGFTQRGLLGASADARRIAQDIFDESWKADHPSTHFLPFNSNSPTSRPPTVLQT